MTDVASHHVFVKIPRSVQLAEVGPRFEMKRELATALSLCFLVTSWLLKIFSV
jgi:hypothetical protein